MDQLSTSSLYCIDLYVRIRLPQARSLIAKLFSDIKFLDTSTEFLFGESINNLSPQTLFRTKEFLEAFHYAQRGMGVRVQLGKMSFLFPDKKWRESMTVAHAFANGYVDKAIEFRRNFLAAQGGREASTDESEVDHSGQRYVLLHEMAKETGNRDELRNQILHVFLAGHDATAITISNAIFHLSRDSNTWKKLRGEVLAAGDAPFTFESLKSLKYLQYIIKESM